MRVRRHVSPVRLEGLGKDSNENHHPDRRAAIAGKAFHRLAERV